MPNAIPAYEVIERLHGLRHTDPIYRDNPFMYDFAKLLADSMPEHITGRDFYHLAKHIMLEVTSEAENIPKKYSRLQLLSLDDIAFINAQVKNLATLTLPEKAGSEAHYFWNVDNGIVSGPRYSIN